MRRPEDVLDTFWTPYGRSIYLLYLGGTETEQDDYQNKVNIKPKILESEVIARTPWKMDPT